MCYVFLAGLRVEQLVPQFKATTVVVCSALIL